MGFSLTIPLCSHKVKPLGQMEAAAGNDNLIRRFRLSTEDSMDNNQSAVIF